MELTRGKWQLAKAMLETYMNELKALSADVALPADWNEQITLAAATQWAFVHPTCQAAGPH
jgi:hypothetical protein